jgi:hypothetical protein
MPHKDPVERRAYAERYRTTHAKQHNEYKKAWFNSHKRAQWRYLLKTAYGITELDYERMVKEQAGVCKLCGDAPKIHRRGTEPRLWVDHCHKTNRVRGLLCAKCNNGLGQFRDDPELMKKAAAYVLDQLG